MPDVPSRVWFGLGHTSVVLHQELEDSWNAAQMRGGTFDGISEDWKLLLCCPVKRAVGRIVASLIVQV